MHYYYIYIDGQLWRSGAATTFFVLFVLYLHKYFFILIVRMYYTVLIIITYYVCLAGDLPYLPTYSAGRTTIIVEQHTVPHFRAHAVPSAGTTQQQLFCLLPTTDYHLPQQPLRREAAPTWARLTAGAADAAGTTQQQRALLPSSSHRPATGANIGG